LLAAVIPTTGSHVFARIGYCTKQQQATLAGMAGMAGLADMNDLSAWTMM